MITLDNVQTDLDSLHADLTENNLQRDEVKERIKIIHNNLEEIIALHGLWERGRPESIPTKLVSWYTSTVYCDVEHPKYGKHQVTPRQIRYSSGEYKSKLFKDIIKTAIDYAVNPHDRKLADKIIEATGAAPRDNEFRTADERLKENAKKLIDDIYPEHINLGYTPGETNYNGVHGAVYRVNGDLIYLRTWSPTKKGGRSQVEWRPIDEVIFKTQDYKIITHNV